MPSTGPDTQTHSKGVLPPARVWRHLRYLGVEDSEILSGVKLLSQAAEGNKETGIAPEVTFESQTEPEAWLKFRG